MSSVVERGKSLLLAAVSPRQITFSSPTSPYRQPVVAFGAALILMIWSGATLLLFEDSHALRTKAERDAVNFARVGQQNATGMLRGVEAKLKFLRWLDRRENYRADWRTLLADTRLLDDDDAEIGVANRDGLIVATTRNPEPDKLVDLSAAPSFTRQKSASADGLIIGPAQGFGSAARLRASMKRFDANGDFSGIFVFEFPADYFERQFAGLDLGVDGGIAIVGDDDRIRSGSGVFASRLNETLDRARETLGDGFEGERGVADFPLRVVSRVSSIETNASWRLRRALVVAGAALASLLTVAATARVARQRTQFEREILHISRHDALTGLPNRVALSTELERLYGEENAEFALHVLDLDRFKTVNDTYGHIVGDELLRMAAGRLRSVTRAGDMVARLGGDEFAILQHVKTYGSDAKALARRVNSAMAQPFLTSRISLHIGATVGTAQGVRDGATAADLMKSADLALYAAKADGRGGARLFQRAMTDSTVARIEMERDLRMALVNNELYLDYQPIHSLRGSGLIGYEALMRWRRGGALVPPAEFIPAAEELGLIHEMGAWALRRACLDLVAMPGAPEVSVNVAPAQIDAGRLIVDVRDALEASGLHPRRLRIEITESALLHDRPIVAEQLRSLREMGVGVSLDDFGTGYSCLSYLEIYPIDTLKIDQRFVRKLGARAEATATLRAIVDLARSFGMKTVAEGVETEEQLRAMAQLGCDRAQGYLLGRPTSLPKSSAEALGTAA